MASTRGGEHAALFLHRALELPRRGDSSTAWLANLRDPRYSAVFGYHVVGVLPRDGGTTARWTGRRAVGVTTRGSLCLFGVGLVQLTWTMVLLVFCMFAFAGIDRQPLIRQ